MADPTGPPSCDLAVLVLILGWLPLGISSIWLLAWAYRLRRDFDALDRTQRERWGLEDHGRRGRSRREDVPHG